MIILVVIFLVIVPLISLVVLYAWVGKKQRELGREEFLAWCKRSYFGMDEPLVAGAPEKRRTASAKQAVKETREAPPRHSLHPSR